MKKKIEALFVLVTIGLTASAVLANYNQRQKVTSTPHVVAAQHGNSLAVSGNTMVVGAQFDGTTASQAGAAYVYVSDGVTWTQQARLLAGDGAVADKFGTSVAISGNTIVVGAFNADAPLSNSGAAYVFVRSGTTWTQQQKITANDATADDQFGFSSAITGDVLMVGANHADLPGNSEAGAVYVYVRTGTVWTQTQRLNPSLDVLLGDHFGDSLAVGPTKLIIGASGDDTPLTAAGAVYVFGATGSTYAFEQKLFIANGNNGDQFGFSVGYDGTTIVGGAKENTTIPGQVAIGAAYVFTFNGSTWSQQQKLIASDGLAFDRFGYSVGVSGDTVAVGAREDDTAAGPDTGSAYIFTRTGTVWTQKQKLLPSDSFNGDRFGVSMTFTSTADLIVGAAEKALTNPNGQGAVYTFSPSTTLFDFDADGKADLSVYRPSAGNWYYQGSTSGVSHGFGFGSANFIPVPADFTGDRKTDITLYGPADGTWYVLRSEDFTFYAFPFGSPGDIPAPADYDGDGKADPAVYRPSSSTWYILRSTGGVTIVQFGISTDQPVPADYDGDGKADIAIYRAGPGQWWELRSSNGQVFAATFGGTNYRAIPGDYTGDGKADVAVYDPSGGNWFILRSEDFSFYAFPFGAAGDKPVPADYDGDGKFDAAVFRPSDTNWYILKSSGGVYIQQYGASADIPLPNVFVR